MKKLFLFFGLALAVSAFAQAKTPPEVLKPYKEYRAALEVGDKDMAFKSAKAAWDMAEEILGDHKTTGDLAINFAVLKPKHKNYSYKDYQSRMKAHKRSIELAHLYDERAVEVELERHLKLIETGLTLTQIKNGRRKSGGKTTYFADMEKALDKYNMKGSTFGGDMEVLRIRYHEFANRPKAGIEAAKRAELIYANRTDNNSTHYPVFLRLFKGNVLKDAGKHIEAVLEYQSVMQNLEGKLPPDHAFIKTAFTEWVRTRSELEEVGRLDEAEKAGLCQCWPFEEYKNDVVPLKRIPPKMPRNAKRSGHVTLVFDVNEDGNPFNVRILNSTEKVFEDPAIASVKKWVYSPIGRGENAKVHKDVSSRVTFKLTNSSGKIIPAKR